MSNEIVNWQEQMENMARASAALERPQVSTMSLKSGVMSYQDVPIPGNKLPCVIVASIFENKFYAGRYDPTKVVIPDCFAHSTDGVDMAPHEAAQNPQHTSCLGCPNNEWGSAGNGSRGKACKETRKLALIPAEDLKDGNVAKAPIAILPIPVTSVANWKKYVNMVALEYKRPPLGVLTEICVVPNAKTQFEVLFNALGVVQSEEALAGLMQKSRFATEVLMKPYEPIEEQAPQEKQAPVKGKKF